MHMKKTAKFVLLLESDSIALQDSAIKLAGSDAYLLVARTPAAAIEFARQYKPSYLIVSKSQAAMEGSELQNLLVEFSPDTELVPISDQETLAAIEVKGADSTPRQADAVGACGRTSG